MPLGPSAEERRSSRERHLLPNSSLSTHGLAGLSGIEPSAPAPPEEGASPREELAYRLQQQELLAALIGANLESPAGFAFHTGRPVISNHLHHETRFRTPELLAEHGVRRALNVIMSGEGEAFGV